MSVRELDRPNLEQNKGEPSASFTPAQARNYQDALLSLGVDNISAERLASKLTCVGPQCERVNKEAVKAAVRTVFGNGKETPIFIHVNSSSNP